MARRLLFDIEGNGLLDTVTTVHCIAAQDIDTREKLDWGPDAISQALETMATADKLVAHFGLGYDFPALEKVCKFVVPREKKGDTVVISKVIYPNLRDTDSALVQAKTLPGAMHGKHSIEAWGYRLGRPKLHTDIEDWSVWTPQLHERCIGDVDTNMALWDHLEPDSYSQQALALEHRIAELCFMMQAAGWPFDIESAQALHVELLDKLHPIERQLVEDFGFWFEPKDSKKKVPFKDPATGREVMVYPWFTPKKPDAKRGYDGEWSTDDETVVDLFAEDGEPTLRKKKVFHGYPLTKIEQVTFNPSSRTHIINALKKRGWKPKAFTEAGTPKLDDEVLEELSDQFPQGGPLVEYLLLDKRIGQVATGDKAWLKQVGDDGCMHGTIDPMGTSTSRASHYDPNLGQVPASKSPYGKECRRLFTVKKGFKAVGADMSGLQLRCLGHYLAPFDGGEYGKAVATGDPHWRVVQAMGLTQEARDKHNDLHEVMRESGAKRLMYATVFGCFDDKAGSIIRDCCTTARTKGLGTQLYERYFGNGETNREVGGPVRLMLYEKLGLKKLLDKLAGIRATRFVEGKRHRWTGFVPALDGRWVPSRSDHATLAALLQSAEAILCKTWVVSAYDALIAAGYRWGWDGDFVFVGWVHDELQCGVREGKEDEVAKILTDCARKAGEPYAFRVPLASEAKVGLTWADTH